MHSSYIYKVSALLHSMLAMVNSISSRAIIALLTLLFLHLHQGMYSSSFNAVCDLKPVLSASVLGS